MDHFAGLDVSVKQTSICIVDDTGRIVKEVTASRYLKGKPCTTDSWQIDLSRTFWY